MGDLAINMATVLHDVPAYGSICSIYLGIQHCNCRFSYKRIGLNPILQRNLNA